MTVYVGIDLHSTNTYVAMIDAENKTLYKHRHRNDLSHIMSALDPYKGDIGG
jgi:transposase